MDLRRCNGISIVEIIVVVAIIAVISAITFPLWASSKQKAHEAETVLSLKQLWIALELYRQDYDGASKFVGTGHELGLPNQDGFAELRTTLKLKWHKKSDRKAYGPVFYPADQSDLVPGYESFLATKLRRWTNYNRAHENLSVIVGDFNHTETCGQFPVETCFFKGFGITLDGSSKRKQAAGNIHTCEWWEK